VALSPPSSGSQEASSRPPPPVPASGSGEWTVATPVAATSNKAKKFFIFIFNNLIYNKKFNF
jgi:hypothetical protein